jgi:hypothetical protein
MDQSRLTCDLSVAFVGLLDVRRMVGELIVLDRRVRSLALPSVLVDSSVGLFAIT